MKHTHATGVYRITNRLNNKSYIGSAARRFSDRWTQHRNELKHGKHHSRHLQSAWDKYGQDNFHFAIVLTSD